MLMDILFYFVIIIAISLYIIFVFGWFGFQKYRRNPITCRLVVGRKQNF